MNAVTDREEVLPWLTTIEKMGKQKSYKPILLLSIIAEIESGNITENKIPLTDPLVERFNSFYENINNQQALNKAYLPYYHLKTDVWDIRWHSSESKIPSSISGAGKLIKHVTFKQGFFDLLNKQSTRELIKERLFLKAEEDIRLKDPRKNEAFTPPRNIARHLDSNFGTVEIPSEPDSLIPREESVVLEFAQEKLLKESLVDHWNEIPEFRERNLQIYGGPTKGVEYDAGTAGRIDILAENEATSDLTVIELKRGKSGEQHLGQLLRYMGWVRSKLSLENDVYGLLIASGFRESVRFAIRELRKVGLMEYDLLMAEITYNKLVRDKIPDIIRAERKEPITRQATDDEMPQLLLAKSLEEIEEYCQAGNVEELVDILEVLKALVAVHGLDWNDFEKLCNKKRASRGGFEKRVYLIAVKEAI
jgi:predicted house-cleaning noncanonical NTP pyrophosphatase (MazG superfamily)